MSEKTETAPDDLQLQRVFRALRQQEAGMAPPVPSRAQLSATVDTPPNRVPLLGAVAASMVGMAMLLAWWQMEKPVEDPGMQYAQIMATASFSTDHLMTTSDGLAPEFMAVPTLYRAPGLVNRGVQW